MKYFLHLAYKGTAYQGWQRQPNALGIQEVIEQAMSTILREKISLRACGRTDAGVHAQQFFAHFIIEKKLPNHFPYRINSMLPKDIVIYDLIEVAKEADAQKDAIKRRYDYFFYVKKNVFFAPFSVVYEEENPRIDLMKKAVSQLVDAKDFYSFCLRPKNYAHTHCQIYSANLWYEETTGKFHFQIEANRFLQGMIRLLIGRIMEIGRGVISLEEWTAYLQDQQPLRFRTPALAQGLFLSKVEYPYLKSEEIKKPSRLFFLSEI